jgi:hypothetical protein
MLNYYRNVELGIKMEITITILEWRKTGLDGSYPESEVKFYYYSELARLPVRMHGLRAMW